MGVSALHKVLIVTFFTIGFICGNLFSMLWDVAADAARPQAGSAAAILESLQVGNSKVYLVR